jgi:hypothetical protein
MAIDNEDIHKPTGTVYMEKSLTKNMGNHQFAKITVGMSLPINYTRADLVKARKAIKRADRMITEELEEQINELDI